MMPIRTRLLHVTLAAAGAIALVAASPIETRQPHTTIVGAGATFPYPIYSAWFAEYAKLKPEGAFSYQSIGSGGGLLEARYRGPLLPASFRGRLRNGSDRAIARLNEGIALPPIEISPVFRGD